jgi:hypothetical protein
VVFIAVPQLLPPLIFHRRCSSPMPHALLLFLPGSCCRKYVMAAGLANLGVRRQGAPIFARRRRRRRW